MTNYPEWLQDLEKNRNGQIAHQFVLHDNTYDLVLTNGIFGDDQAPYLPLRTYLARYLKEKADPPFDWVIFYNQSIGLTTREVDNTIQASGTSDEMDRQAAKSTNGPVSVASTKGASRVSLEEITEEFNPVPQGPPTVGEALLFIEQLMRQSQYTVAIIVEHLDKLAPDQGAGVVIEALSRLALDRDIQEKTDNILIGLTAQLERVAPELYGADSLCRSIQVPMPDEQVRQEFLEILLDEFQQSPESSSEGGPGEEPTRDIAPPFDFPKGYSIEELAKQAKGFMLAHLDQLVRRACMGNRFITPSLVKKMKQEIISSDSRGLLEEREPRHGFEAIGGLEHIKEYLESVKGYLKDQPSLVPKGILLAGPPGTGKTLIAEALASEMKRNVVRMGNIRARWVGESERNLSKALSIIQEIAPVIVFVDEIDQAIGGRGTGQSGDSGVGERMFGRILEAMGSNESRGEIIWVAATNRADVLDEAMVRRFDRVFPVLIPGTPAARLAISLSMRHQIGDDFEYDQQTLSALEKQSAMQDAEYDGPDSRRESWEGVKIFGEKTDGLTGSDLEIIIRRAMELAAGQPVSAQHLLEASEAFKSNHHQDMYHLQTLLAVAACNFIDMIPPKEAFHEDLQEVIGSVLADRNNRAIDEKVDEYKQRLGMKRLV